MLQTQNSHRVSRWLFYLLHRLDIAIPTYVFQVGIAIPTYVFQVGIAIPTYVLRSNRIISACVRSIRRH